MCWGSSEFIYPYPIKLPLNQQDPGIYLQFSSLGKPKIKLYRDKEGNLKGDARCCYLKVNIAPKLF